MKRGNSKAQGLDGKVNGLKICPLGNNAKSGKRKQGKQSLKGEGERSKVEINRGAVASRNGYRKEGAQFPLKRQKHSQNPELECSKTWVGG